MDGFFQIFNWLKDEVRHKLDKPQSEPTTDPVVTDGEAYFLVPLGVQEVTMFVSLLHGKDGA